MLKYHALLFFIILLFVQDSVNAAKKKKYQNIEIEQVKYQASIQTFRHDGTFKHYCSGAILTPSLVVTAARCVLLPDVMLNIVAGSPQMTNEAPIQTRKPLKTILHPEFNPFKNEKVVQYDLALVLIEPFTFDGIKGLALPKAGTEPTGDATIAGWGTESAVLKSFNVQIPPQSNCSQFYTGFKQETEFCTKAIEATGSCNINVGSPIVHDNILYGIVSIIDNPCTNPSPVVYAKASAAISFLQEAFGTKLNNNNPNSSTIIKNNDETTEQFYTTNLLDSHGKAKAIGTATTQLLNVNKTANVKTNRSNNGR